MIPRTATEVDGGLAPPSATTANREPSVKVWDPFVRICHWSLVVLFAVAFLTGDEIERIHVAAGYGIAGLVTARIVWGFIGPRFARFSDFVKGPRAVTGYLIEAASLKAPRSLGHNPAGGAMIVALLILLAGLSVTGYLMTTDAYWGSKVLEEIHEALANISLLLIGLHVAGVILSSLEHGENLIKAMITGRKRPL